MILAFETLCDHIAGYNVEIMEDEYNQIIDIFKNSVLNQMCDIDI